MELRTINSKLWRTLYSNRDPSLFIYESRFAHDSFVWPILLLFRFFRYCRCQDFAMAVVSGTVITNMWNRYNGNGVSQSASCTKISSDPRVFESGISSVVWFLRQWAGLSIRLVCTAEHGCTQTSGRQREDQATSNACYFF